MRRARDVEPPEAAIVDVPKLFLAPSLTSTSALPSDLPGSLSLLIVLFLEPLLNIIFKSPSYESRMPNGLRRSSTSELGRG